MEDFRHTVTTPAPGRWNTDSSVAIIGGLGEMGRLFCRFFESQGFKVSAADLGTALTPEEAVRNFDIIVFSVPLHETVAIIRGLVPFMRPGQLVMDLTSLKTAPVREMLTSSASVVGL
ncbi:MAG: prephenate dehydrogenase/arogenate dehydrogenase family protein, partial [Syntrophobacteraceae bacterium]